MPTRMTQMSDLPHRIAVLCYLYDEEGRVLLLHRRKAPNAGMYSPIGGKLEVSEGESPHDCALREIREEAGLRLGPGDIHLCGIVAERAYEGRTHWLIFLFEVLRPIRAGEIRDMMIDEGSLEWVSAAEVPQREIPYTDRHIMWPLVQQNRGGFFAVFIDCSGPQVTWAVQETRSRR
jgi:8-oxo-dGTP diphosphatase